jgi:DNA-directed RNA polymerase subunit RPC12/RpoP
MLCYIQIENKACIMEKTYFCPRCHHPIRSPFRGDNANIIGNLTINCPNCGKGKVLIKGKSDSTVVQG